MERLRAVAARFLKYNTVSFVMFLFDLLFIYTAVTFFRMNYLPAVMLGFLLATTAGFFWNRVWTFHKLIPLPRGITLASLVAISSLIIISWITVAGVEYLGLYFIAARLIAAFFAAIWSYIADSLFTFQVKPFD